MSTGADVAGLLLRGTAAGMLLAAGTVARQLERLADRVNPPPRLSLGLDTFPSVRLCDLTPREKADVMLADPEGYFAQVRAERDAQRERHP